MILAKTFLEKLDQKPSEVAFSAVFSNFDKCRPEVAGDVVSGAVIDPVGLDVPAKFGDSRSNHSRDIPTAHFVMDERRGRWTHVITLRQNVILAFCVKW